MIINNLLEQVLGSKSNILILRILNERLNAITGREAARLTGLSVRSVQLALAKLVKMNIVNLQIGGRDHLYSLNRSSYITEKLLYEIFSFESSFGEIIFEEIKEELSENVISLILFGSVALKKDILISDVDLCIVYKTFKDDLENKVSELRNAMKSRYGIVLSPLYLSIDEFRKRAVEKLSPVPDIINYGKIISGETIKELLNGKKN